MKKFLKAFSLMGAISIANTLTAANYCSLKGTNSNYEWIQSVDNYVTGNNQGYGNYTGNVAATRTAGSSYTLTLKPGLSASFPNATEYWGVWIDYNQNGVLESFERIVNNSTVGSNGFSVTYVIPTNAVNGNTLIRVAMGIDYAINSSSYNPCGSIQYGEVEDYVINIVAGSGGNSNNSGYCSASGNTTYEYITNVGQHNSGNDNGYWNYSNLGSLATFIAGNSTYLQAKAGFTGTLKTVYWAAWIDYNQNNTFEASEKIGSTSSFGVSVAQINFTVPLGSFNGTTRMRVVLSELNLSNVTDPCGTLNYGEIEDHLVTISSNGGGSTPSGNYCTAKGSTNYEYINAVGTFTSGNNFGYKDNTAISNITVYSSNTNTFSLQAGFTAGTQYTEYWSIWMDLNHDNVFSTNEQVLNSYSSYGSSVFNVNLYVPSTALYGQTRMRVVMADKASNLNPCGSFSNGEVEDYTVNILQGSGGNNNNSGNYCSAMGSNSSDEWIDLVAASFTSGNDNGYGNYTNKTINLFTGSNTLSISAGFKSGYTSTEYWSVWIDFNHNLVFESNEKIATDLTTSSDAVYDITNLNIPSSAILGNTRMRIIMSYSTGAQACGNVAFGEVEDYTVNIQTGSGGNSNTYYCNANAGGLNEYIALVGANASTYNGTKYSDYSGGVWVFNWPAGITQQPNIQAGFNGTTSNEYWGIWIDFNQNKIFEANERVSNVYTSGTTKYYTDIYIPYSAKNGTTRMRVVMGPSSTISDANFNPCGYIGNGEVEDYDVVISGGTFAPAADGSDILAKTSIALGLVPAEKDSQVSDFAVFPNPASNFIELGTNFDKGVAYQIMNISGQLVAQGQISDTKKLDVEKLESGIYFIQVKNGENIQTAKFIKE